MHTGNLYLIITAAKPGLKGAWHWAFIIIMSMASYSRGMAQETPNERLDRLTVKVDSMVERYLPFNPVPKQTVTLNELDRLFRLEMPDSESLEVKLIEAEQKKLSRDIGLDLQAGYLENLEQGVFNVEGIYYRRRAQLEVEWDVLNNGFLDHRQELKELENEKEVARFEHLRYRNVAANDTLYYTIQHYFNGQKASILRGYLDVLNERQEVIAELYNMNYRPWEDVISATSAKARAQVELDSYRTLRRQYSELDPYLPENSSLPLVNIDMEKLLETGRFETLEDSIVSEQIGKINHEYNAWRDISLSTFVRYNYYNSPSDIDLNNIKNREYFSVGINLSVPLPLHKSDNKNIAGLRKDLLNSDLNRNKRRSQHQLYSDYLIYQQKLKQYLGAYENYLQLQTGIKKEQQREKLEDPSYSSMEVMDMIARRYDVALQMMNIKQDLYEILLKVGERISIDHYRQIVYQIEAEDLLASSEIKAIDIYMWSATFEAMKNRDIIDVLQKRKIDRVLLSTGTKDYLISKAERFIELAHLNNIQVELMIGDNNLYLEGHDEEIQKLIKRAVKVQADGVHLDVEPHAKNDGSEPKSEYLPQYQKFLADAAGIADKNQMPLSISIPVFYDDALNELVKYAERIYVMAYGSNDTGKVMERLKNEKEVLGDKLIIALRPSDFNSRQEYFSFLNELKKKSGISHFAHHDVEALLKLNELEMTINNYEE